MISYSARIKQELIRLRVRRKNDAKALLCAFTLSIGALKRLSQQQLWGVHYVSESEASVLFAAKLASKFYGLEYDIKQVRHERLRAVYNELLLYGDKLTAFMLEIGFMRRDAEGNEIFLPSIPYDSFKTGTQKRMFLRGLFLACGTVVKPEKAYHAELVLKNEEIADFALSLLSESGIAVKRTKRKDSIVLYIKDAGSLSDFLAFIGAASAMMDVANIRIIKQANSEANRGVNCINANLDRLSRTGLRQAEAVRIIIDAGGFENLTPSLRAVAEARLNNPDMSLSELAEALGIGRSAVNYRLRKLSLLASEIQIKNGLETIPFADK